MKQFNINAFIQNDLVEVYLNVPDDMAGKDAPDIKSLPEYTGDLLMCFATAMKNCEIAAKKHNKSFNGYINNELKVDRPVIDILKQ